MQVMDSKVSLTNKNVGYLIIHFNIASIPSHQIPDV